jgi:hypothetical protein
MILKLIQNNLFFLNNKAVGIVSYGGTGGARAAENQQTIKEEFFSLVVNKKGYPREILFIGYPLIFT